MHRREGRTVPTSSFTDTDLRPPPKASGVPSSREECRPLICGAAEALLWRLDFRAPLLPPVDALCGTKQSERVQWRVLGMVCARRKDEVRHGAVVGLQVRCKVHFWGRGKAVGRRGGCDTEWWRLWRSGVLVQVGGRAEFFLWLPFPCKNCGRG